MHDTLLNIAFAGWFLTAVFSSLFLWIALKFIKSDILRKQARWHGFVVAAILSIGMTFFCAALEIDHSHLFDSGTILIEEATH